jgi:glycosyltransferase involved in cell wall biosynthesis
MKNKSLTPSISVVIPSHNAQSTIHTTLKRVLAQQQPCDEIIIVDNNSHENDHTASIVASLNEPSIRYLKPAECANGNVARNIGSEASTSDFIAYCDSDDEWDVDHLASRVVLHQQTQALAIYSGAKIRNGKHVKQDLSRAIKVNESAVEFVIGANKALAQTSSFFVHQSVWQKSPWDETLKRHQDYEFFIAVQQDVGWHYLDQATYYLNWHATDIRQHHFASYWDFYSKYKEQLADASKARYLFTRWKEAQLFAPQDAYKQQFESELAQVKQHLAFSKKVLFSQPWLLTSLWPVLRHYI